MARCREATLFLRLGPWDLIVARCPALIPRRRMRSSFRMVHGKRTSCVILATAIAASCSRAIHDWNLTRRAGFCVTWLPDRGLRGKPRLYITFIYAPDFFSIFFSTFAQVSFIATVRLNTGRPDSESRSTHQYPSLSD